MEMQERLDQLEWQGQVAMRRLDKLERANRRWMAVSVIAVLLAGVSGWLVYPTLQARLRGAAITITGPDGVEQSLLLSAYNHEGTTTVSLRDAGRNFIAKVSVKSQGPEIELSDAVAPERKAALSLGAAGPEISLSDPRNGYRLRGAVDPSGPAVSLEDRTNDDWRRRAVFGLSVDGPSLRIYGADGKLQSEFPSKKEESPSGGPTETAAPKEVAKTSDLVEARGFRLLDARGTARAELTLLGEQPAFLLRSAEGKRGAEISMGEAGPSIRLFDEKERPRVVLGAGGGEEAAKLNFLDDKGEPKLQLSVDPDGVSSQLSVWDSRGRSRARFGVEHDGSYVGLSGLDGKPRALLGVLGSEPSLQFFDGMDKTIVSIATEESGAVVALSDSAGQPRAALSVAGDGDTSLLSLFDTHQNETRLRAAFGVSQKTSVFQLIREDGSVAQQFR